MNTERMVNIILSDLSVNNLKLQQELERIINSSSDETSSKVFKVKNALKELVVNELMIQKFQNVVSAANNNNNLKENQNG